MDSYLFKKGIIKVLFVATFIIGIACILSSFKDEAIAVNATNTKETYKGESKVVNGRNVMFFHPTHGGVITSAFGERWGKMHKGLDISRASGDDVVACLDGVVKSRFFEAEGYGNVVIIDHGNGYESRYAHMSSFNVNVGDKVKGGSKVGSVGSTGKSTGPHLHFEIRVNDKPINPENYID
ncbi:MAG: M23 family metallopeptidase [Clostridium sp.]|uniref:M23 family metallopeptidase n=1 Tax=Clostridium sp. TaxID=1506 RepID=UPI003F31ABA3